MAQATQTDAGRALGVAMSKPTLDGLTVGTSDGGVATMDLGRAATDKVGLYGATPVVQRATAATHTLIATTVAVSTTSSVATGWGFSTSTQANQVTTILAEIQATLLALGIWAA